MRTKTSIEIVWGIGCLERVRLPFNRRPSPKAARTAITEIRDKSCAHWAFLAVNGRRVDDDQLANALKRARA